MTSVQPPRGALLAVFITVFLDMVGVGIALPVLASLLLDPTSTLLPIDASQLTRTLAYGGLLASYSLAQFFGAPVLGALSDTHGRRPLLSLSLLGTVIGYLIFAVGLWTSNLWLLLLGRAIDGLSGGNVSIAFSAIADITPAAKRPQAFGMVGMAFGLGFILGPALGGLLSDSRIHPLFTPVTPFLVAAGLSSLNLLLLRWRFQETLVTRRQTPLRLLRAIDDVRLALWSDRRRGLFWTLLLLSLGFTLFTQFHQVFLIEKLGVGNLEVGLFFTCVGLCVALVQGGIVRPIAKRWPPVAILDWSILGVALCLGLFPLTTSFTQNLAIVPLLALVQGLTGPNLQGLLSQQSPDQQQGESLGLAQAVQSLGTAIPPLVGGVLAGWGTTRPLVLACIVSLVGYGCFQWVGRPRGKFLK
jgi:DHA1 family tetracycline resistance protein-like MFS transporter